MNALKVLCASILGLGVWASAQETTPVPLACNLKAISAADRPRYGELVKRVRAALRDRKELPNGYALRLNGKLISLPEAAEWISMERLCCPFLTLALSTSGNDADWVLTLTGPDGVKAVLEAEFAAATQR